MISWEDRGTYLPKKECELRAWIPLRPWVCMLMALICSSSVLSSSQNLDLDSTLLSVCKPSKYFPQATSCHFCAQVKFQLLMLSNCRFLSICSIPLFSSFLAVSPILLAVGNFIPELFISSFRSLISTKEKSPP